jgi:anti-sigma regulatory factor (Ser/Thr protein kinase)
MSTRLTRKITNELHSLESLMNATTNFLEDHGVDAQTVYRVNLALEEMITNIIKYGYDDYDGHEIDVSLEILPDEILAVIEDDGHEFDPLTQQKKDMADVPLEEHEAGGLGIHLIKQMVGHMSYRRENERNILEIRAQRKHDPKA